MSNSMSIGALKPYFAFPFQGSEWKKRFLVGALLVFASFIIPIIPLIFVCGYIVQVMRQTIEGEDLVLPEWGDLSQLGADGLKYIGVSTVFMLPAFIVYFGGMTLYFISSFALPILMESGYGNRGLPLGPFLLVFGGSFVIMFVSMFLGMLLNFAGAIPLPVAMAHFVAEDKFGAAFRFREWWKLLWRNKWGYFIAWTVIGGLAVILYSIFMLLYFTIVLCLVIPLVSAPVAFYLMLVWAAVFGQMYRESKSMVESELEQVVEPVEQ